MKTPKVATPKTLKVSNTPKSGLIKKKGRQSNTPFKGSSSAVKLLREYAVQNGSGKSPSKNSPEVELGLKIEALLEKGVSSSPESSKTPPPGKSKMNNKGGKRLSFSDSANKPNDDKKGKLNKRKSLLLAGDAADTKSELQGTPKVKGTAKTVGVAVKESSESQKLSDESCITPGGNVKKEKSSGIKQDKLKKQDKSPIVVGTPSSKGKKRSNSELAKTPVQTPTEDNQAVSQKKVKVSTPRPAEKLSDKTPKASGTPRVKLSAQKGKKLLQSIAEGSPELEKAQNLKNAAKESGKKNTPKANKKNEIPKGKSAKQVMKKQEQVTDTQEVKEENNERTTLLDQNKVVQGVEALFKSHMKKLEENSKLLASDASRVLLTINCIKSLVTPNRFLRISVPHPLCVDTGDICLIVADKSKSKSNSYNIAEHYKNILKKFDLNYVIEVIPLKTLRTSYTQFEQKKKLCERFDMIMVEGKISHRVLHLLGSAAYKSRKIPVPVKNLAQKECLEQATKKATINLNAFKNTFSCEIGHTEMSVEDITDNIMTLVENLKHQFPGGWLNIRSLYINTPICQKHPLYLSLVSPVEVPMPIAINKKRAKAPVTDELSTIPGAVVTVHPDGEVTVKRRRKDSSSDEEEVDVDEKNDVNGEESSDVKFKKNEENTIMENKEINSKTSDLKEDSEEDSSDDEDIEAAEKDYLLELESELPKPKNNKQKSAVKNKKKKGPSVAVKTQKKTAIN